MLLRRCLLLAGLPLPRVAQALQPVPATDMATATTALRGGGVVLALRHALAPGTFDPPGFRLGDCSTQRNLSDEGRAQARHIGQWLAGQGLRPTRVRSSPWCRCMDTATLAFGQAQAWGPLGSPRQGSEADNARHLQQLRQALQAAAQGPGFEVWVTHNFVLQALVGEASASGEGLVLRTGPPPPQVQLLGRFTA